MNENILMILAVLGTLADIIIFAVVFHLFGWWGVIPMGIIFLLAPIIFGNLIKD